MVARCRCSIGILWSSTMEANTGHLTSFCRSQERVRSWPASCVLPDVLSRGTLRGKYQAVVYDGIEVSGGNGKSWKYSKCILADITGKGTTVTENKMNHMQYKCIDRFIAVVERPLLVKGPKRIITDFL